MKNTFKLSWRGKKKTEEEYIFQTLTFQPHPHLQGLQSRMARAETFLITQTGYPAHSAFPKAPESTTYP